ncbi:MAG: EF-hand domain-containing protein [Arcobacteraceae bacterium]|nr:EF-hand domain-containing protein [Arcobacteraceae bacterium]
MKVQRLIKTTTLTVGTLCLLGSLANGAELSQKGPISFSIYDTNKDGFVSENEFYDTRAKRMSIKANQGKAMRKAGNAPAFGLFDSNDDGKLTKLELLEGQNTQMQKNRTNKGSKKGRMNKGQKGGMQGTQQGRINKGQRGSRQSMQRNMPTFENFDLNNDGHLTEKEMNKARNKRMLQNAQQGKMLRYSGNSTSFSNIDTNNDGKVSKDEFLTNQLKKR